MKKKFKRFLGVIYYLVTFSIGLMIALVMPAVNRDIIMYEYLDEYINEGDYVKAIDLLGGIYNKQCAYENEDNKLAIYENTSMLEIKNEEDESSNVIINASYICFIKGLEREWFESLENNQSKILIDGTKKIEILQYDLNEDGNLDTVSTLLENDYICFSIDESLIGEANSLELIKANGDVLFKVDNLNLKFESDFFNQIDEFVEKYNLYYEDKLFSEEENTDLENIYNEINSNNSNYQKSGTYSLEEIGKAANKKSMTFVLWYFIWIYVLGDFIVGPRYILRFVKFIYNKIKMKFKRDEDENPLALTNNFYCQLTFEAVCDCEINDDIIISYENVGNSDLSFKCVITASNEFKKTERVRGGEYRLIDIECLNHEILNVPETLSVKGYKMNIKFNVKKIEGNHKEE